MSSALFDRAAADYDSVFTNSVVGQAQRSQVWNYIRSMELQHGSTVLEVNCGTGEDAAMWAGNGFKILATDISGKMIEKAKSKYPEIEFLQRDMRVPPEGKYDIIFSDFGGLNCLSAGEVKKFISTMHDSLHEEGRLILVAMGRKCAWDGLFQLTKGRFSAVFRRAKREGLPVQVDGQTVHTHYYSPKDLRKWSQFLFREELLRPVGLLVPPSYLSPYFSRNRRFFSVLEKLDRRLAFSFLSDFADHYFVSLKKRSST